MRFSFKFPDVRFFIHFCSFCCCIYCLFIFSSFVRFPFCLDSYWSFVPRGNNFLSFVTFFFSFCPFCFLSVCCSFPLAIFYVASFCFSFPFVSHFLLPNESFFQAVLFLVSFLLFFSIHAFIFQTLLIILLLPKLFFRFLSVVSLLLFLPSHSSHLGFVLFIPYVTLFLFIRVALLWFFYF